MSHPSTCPLCGPDRNKEKPKIEQVVFKIGETDYSPINVDKIVKKRKIRCPKCGEEFNIVEVIE